MIKTTVGPESFCRGKNLQVAVATLQTHRQLVYSVLVCSGWDYRSNETNAGIWEASINLAKQETVKSAYLIVEAETSIQLPVLRHTITINGYLIGGSACIEEVV